MYGGNGLITNLVPLHYYQGSHRAYDYRCYIQLPNDTVVHAFLEPGTQAREFSRSTCVFVRIPDGFNRTYSGVLVPLHRYRPS